MAQSNTNGCEHVNKTMRRLTQACLAALVIMLICGIFYRYLYLKLDKYLSQPVKLPVPLSAFPIQIGNWVGQAVPVSETVQEVAGNDDFISRFYQNTEKGQGVSLYVAYSARPRYMQGHRPAVCYPAAGWNHEGTDQQTLITKNGQRIPCMIHRFSRVTPYDQSIFVLNFYLVNGQITLDEKRFSDIASRNPNLDGNPAQYVAQIQIMSQSEDSILNAGRDFVDEIIRYFPDTEGKVAVTAANASAGNP